MSDAENISVRDDKLSLVNTSFERFLNQSFDIKRQNLGFSQKQMEWWLRGKAGQEYLGYIIVR